MENAEWKKIHEKKPDKFFSEKPTTTNYNIRPTENIIHDFSSYVLTAVEKYALSFGLDHHIPS